MIERALENLLDNALRHTPRGGQVRVALLTGDAEKHITVRVADTGSGIAPEVLPHVFERHYRPQGSAHNAEAGAGLGLAITRRIIELHGGTIEARSTPGQGATFTFSLPVAPARDEKRIIA